MKTEFEQTKNEALSIARVSGSALDYIPARIKYYLLDWKKKYIEDFVEKFGDVRLRDLSADQLHALFIYASAKDLSYWVF